MKIKKLFQKAAFFPSGKAVQVFHIIVLTIFRVKLGQLPQVVKTRVPKKNDHSWDPVWLKTPPPPAGSMCCPSGVHHEVTGCLQLPPLLLHGSSVVLLVAVVWADGRAVGGRGWAVSRGGGAVRGAFRTSWRVRRRGGRVLG